MSFAISETTDIDACRALRMEVFVREQNVPMDEEIDDLDDICVHLLCTDAAGVAVGTARIYELGNIGKIGRVCVKKSHRGLGLGARLIEEGVAKLSTRPHIKTAKLGAQKHAIPFYERLGFSIIGEEYLDAGIPHFDMIKAL